MNNITIKDIPGWEDYYEITINGEIYSKYRLLEYTDAVGRPYQRPLPRRLRKARTNGKYPHIFVDAVRTINGKKKVASLYPHKLVAELWLRKPSAEHRYVEPIDGNYTHICPENLRWMTAKELYKKQVKAGRKEVMDLYKYSPIWKGADKSKGARLAKLFEESKINDLLYFTIADRAVIYNAARKAGVKIATSTAADNRLNVKIIKIL